MIWLKLDLRAESKEKCNLCRLCRRADMLKNGAVALSLDFSKKRKCMRQLDMYGEEQGEKRKKDI